MQSDHFGYVLRNPCGSPKPETGLILHLGGNSQYPSLAYRRLAASFGMTMSMSQRASTGIDVNHDAGIDLEKLVRSRHTPQAVLLRAWIVLITTTRVQPSVIAEELDISQPMVRKWRLRCERSEVCINCGT